MIIEHDLYDQEYPAIPFKEIDKWRPQLRWLVSVMDDDDDSLGFIAGCLSYCIANGNITARQSVGCLKVLKRVRNAFLNYQLDSQNVGENL